MRLEVEQRPACQLPRLPPAASLSCASLAGREMECRLDCGQEQEQIQVIVCNAGRWDKQPGCPIRDGGNVTAACGAGCLVPELPHSGLQCGAGGAGTWCEVRCPPGRSSPAPRAECEWDRYCALLSLYWSDWSRSGWEARWSRLLLPCQLS